MTGLPTVSIVTAITDAYDTLKAIPPQVGVNVRCVAVTDGTEVAEPGHGWEIIHFADVPHLTAPDDHRHPNRLAKVPKCLPWQFAPAPNSIWIDASYRVTSPTFAFDVLKCAKPIAQFVHPWRDCVFEEANASLGLTRYDDTLEAISSQKNEYENIGHPHHWGLWATGVIVRQHTDDVRLMSGQWLWEIRRHSYQDQISEPVSLRLCDLRPSPLPGNHIENPWLKYEGSARH